MTRQNYLVFSVSFWLIASLVLFVDRYSVARHHLDVAYVRYGYLFAIGLLISSVMTSLYNSEYFTRAPKRLGWVILVSGLAALTTSLILNPITYLMVGYDIFNVQHEILSTGTLYFALFYFLWSALYFQVSGRSVLKAKAENSPTNSYVFKVEKRGEKRLLQDRDICCITASGDYVELITANNTYMIKETLRKLEDQLDRKRFKRVHRSSIVNSDKIKSVVARPGGAFEILLDGGHLVQSSRSYKTVVEDILPKA